MITWNDDTIFEIDLIRPRTGGWSASFTVKGDHLDDENGTLKLPDGGPVPGATVEYKGTVVSARRVEGGTLMKIVAGPWTISRLSKAKAWSVGTVTRTIISEILSSTGASIATLSRPDMLIKPVEKWQVIKDETVASALTRLAKLTTDGVWRIDPDGSVLFNVDLFLQLPSLKSYPITSADSNSVTLSATGMALWLQPGNKFSGKIGDKVVSFNIEETRFRSSGESQTITVRSVDTVKDKTTVINAAVRAQLLGRTWSGTILTQDPITLTCNIDPDDEAIKGYGIQLVPIWLGVPGTVKVPPSTRCTFIFLNGDPQLPAITGFESASLLELKLGDGLDFVSLSQLVDANFNTITTFLNSQLVLATPVGPTTAGATVPLSGIVPTAATKVKAV